VIVVTVMVMVMLDDGCVSMEIRNESTILFYGMIGEGLEEKVIDVATQTPFRHGFATEMN